MYIAHQKLAYMAAAAADPDTACQHLREAYKLHQRQSIRARFDIIPRTNFVESVMKGVEAVDAKTGAKWKSGFVLDTNVVTEVKGLFESGPPASSDASNNGSSRVPHKR
jgi:hypothetical protein